MLFAKPVTGYNPVVIKTDAIPYINLQWNRKLFSAGTFQVTLSMEDYIRMGGSKWSGISVVAENESITLMQPSNTDSGTKAFLVGHYEIGLIFKRSVERGNGSNIVSLSGMMADCLIDGAVSAKRYSADSVSLSTAFNACWYGTGSGATSSFRFEYPKMYYSRNTTENAPFHKTDYNPDFYVVNLGKHFRPLLEKKCCGFAVTRSNYYGDDLGSFWLTCFMKAGVDRSIEQQNVDHVILQYPVNSSSESISTDYSAGYAGVFNYFSGTLDETVTTANRLKPWPLANEDLANESPFGSAGWNMGWFINNDSTDIEPDSDYQFGIDWVTHRLSVMGDKLVDYTWDTDIDVDVSMMPREEVQKIGLGDWVSIYTELTGTFWKAQVIEIHETVKGEDHTTEFVLGSKRMTNIQRSKLL